MTVFPADQASEPEHRASLGCLTRRDAIRVTAGAVAGVALGACRADPGAGVAAAEQVFAEAVVGY